MSAGKTDIWMPVYIGDYLADTMHLSTEQHGAYLLLLFHLWRRGRLHDDDALLAQITGLGGGTWSSSRAVLAEFFEIHDGLWHHGRVEQERSRVEAKQQSNTNKARVAAYGRWNKPRPLVESAGDAPCNAGSLPGDAKSQSHSESDSDSESSRSNTFLAGERHVADARHTPFRAVLAEYWRSKNHASPEMPWQGRDAKALSDFLAASPSLTQAQFRQMLVNRAKSAVAHGDRVYLWIGNLTRFQEEITVYNKPASAGGSNASRAEINRNSVVNAVDRALVLAREHADRARQAGHEPPAFADAGVSSAYGAGPERRALALPEDVDRGMEARDPAHGQAGADGPLPYGPPAASAGEAAGAGRIAGKGAMLRFEQGVVTP